MSAARRRATLHLLTVVAFGALALTACGGNSEEPTDHTSAAASGTPQAGSAPSAADPSNDGADPDAQDTQDTQDTQASTGKSPWAGTKQFVTIEKAWTEDGLTRLSVRPAQKKVNTQFDTWEITPGTGPFTTVTMAEDARILLTVPVRGDDPSGAGRAEPVPYSHAEFVTLLTKLDPQVAAGVGYDLSFDGTGQVVKLQSLYTS